ncbi:DUF4124 domain-containing protein [Haliea sp. E1-2-M8]|uniref:DUF4124 domain-containing protein n=1 Tax=Haliea sp. E1-2-M8 TaxID=3064706 RepID=UPI00272A8BFB|nr:DUF4124 domain-containing protein [Haliea sp. E1-2-M8]
MQQVFCKGLQGSLIVLLAAGSLHVGAADNYYRWLDNRGNPVHSDRPPPAGIDYEVISTSSGLKRVVPGERGAVPAEVKPRVGNEFKPEPRRTEATSFKNPEICASARKNLNTLKTHARLQVRDNQGDMAYISDEERLRLMNEAQSLIDQYCE